LHADIDYLSEDFDYPLKSPQLLQNFEIVLPIFSKAKARIQHDVPPIKQLVE